MKEERRKIILKEGEPSQQVWIGKALDAEKGQVLSVDAKTAIRAIDTGKFDYVGEDVGVEDRNPDLLPENFPLREKLASGGITAFSQLNLASDEDLLKIEGVGEKTLKQIRTAAQGDSNE